MAFGNEKRPDLLARPKTALKYRCFLAACRANLLAMMWYRSLDGNRTLFENLRSEKIRSVESRSFRVCVSLSPEGIGGSVGL